MLNAQDNWTTVSDGLPASDPSASLGPNFGNCAEGCDPSARHCGAFSSA